MSYFVDLAAVILIVTTVLLIGIAPIYASQIKDDVNDRP